MVQYLHPAQPLTGAWSRTRSNAHTFLLSLRVGTAGCSSLSPHLSLPPWCMICVHFFFFFCLLQMANNTRVYGRHHPLICSLATKCQECREPGGVGVESQCSGVHQWASSIILCRHLITFCVNMHFLDVKTGVVHLPVLIVSPLSCCCCWWWRGQWAAGCSSLSDPFQLVVANYTDCSERETLA